MKAGQGVRYRRGAEDFDQILRVINHQGWGIFLFTKQVKDRGQGQGLIRKGTGRSLTHVELKESLCQDPGASIAITARCCPRSCATTAENSL